MAEISATQNRYRAQKEWKKLALPENTGTDLEQNKISLDAGLDDQGEGAKEKPNHDEISYARLINYYIAHHPTTTAVDSNNQVHSVPFGICDTVGGHDFCCCCRTKQVSKMSKEIGVGATLFLMSTKSLSILFFFLTIINIPVYMFYYASHPASNTLSTPQDYFNALSLGNIGESDYACSAVNWAYPVAAPAVQELSLACSSGTLT